MSNIGVLVAEINLKSDQMLLGLSKIEAALSSFEKKANRSMSSAESSAKNLSRTLNQVKAAFGAWQVANFTRSLYQTAAEIDNLQRAFTVITGSPQGMEKEFAYLRGEADRLGQSFYTLADAYKGFSAAALRSGFSAETTRDMFSSITESATALGLTSEATSGSLYAIQQMMSKGKVSAEELRLQLGERLPGAFALFAEAAGVSTQRLNEMLDRGEVGIEILPRFAELLHRNFGKAAETAITGPAAAMRKFDEAIKDVQATLGSSGLTSVMTDVLNSIRDVMGSDEFKTGIKSFGEGLVKMVEVLKELLPLLTQFSKLLGGIGEGIVGWSNFFKMWELFQGDMVGFGQWAGMTHDEVKEFLKTVDKITEIQAKINALKKEVPNTVFEYMDRDKKIAELEAQLQAEKDRVAKMAEEARKKRENAEAEFKKRDRELNVPKSPEGLSEKELKALAKAHEERLKMLADWNIAVLKSGDDELAVVQATLNEEERLYKNSAAYRLGNPVERSLMDETFKKYRVQMEADALKEIEEKRQEDLNKAKEYYHSIEKMADEATLLKSQALRKEVNHEMSAYKETEGYKILSTAQKQGVDEFYAEWYAAKQKEITELEKDEYEERLKKAEDWLSGVKRALNEYTKEAVNASSIAESATTSAMKTMEDSIVEFCLKGSVAFTDLVDSMIADLMRLAVRAYITSPLFSAISTWMGDTTSSSSYMAPSTGNSDLDMMAGGGYVSSGTSYIVGEEGPEIFTPSSSGWITPNSDISVASPQALNSSGSSGNNVYVTVQDYSGGAEPEVSRNSVSDGDEITIIVGKALAKDLASRGPASKAIERTFQLTRGGLS